MTKPAPYHRLRTVVEHLNRMDRGIPEDASANLSPYQQWCIHQALSGRSFIGVTIPEEGQRHVHGPKAHELSRVLIALARLTLSRREFQKLLEGKQ